MNFGHGELGFGAWPRAKSRPVAEYWTVFSVSTPIALDALPMTVLASCAEAVQTSSAASASPVRHFLNISHRLSLGRSVTPAPPPRHHVVHGARRLQPSGGEGFSRAKVQCLLAM